MTAKKKKVELISYSIKMVIPTVQYGNIQPEIIVKTDSIDEAHDFIVPHMNKLWKEYYLVDGKRPEPTPPAPAPVITPVAKPEPPKPELEAKPEPTPEVVPAPVPEPTPAPATEPPPSSVAFVKATQAINSCMSAEALSLIIDQVYVSVKLTDEDKIALSPLLDEKYKELNENS